MYLNYLISESAVREEIETNEKKVFDTFMESFSLDNIYKDVTNQLASLTEDDVVKTYDNIKAFSQAYTVDYLVNTTKKFL
jgi:hypothetical protein